MNESLKIWCTYHNENIPKEYDLHNTKHIQLFNDDDFTLKEENINYLHDYLGEITTYYYVWKNQIKSDYVGFCQYRRHYQYINYEDLKNNGIVSYWNCVFNDNTLYDLNKGVINDFIFFDFINYMYYKYNIDVNDNIFINVSQKVAYHSMNIYRWDIFNEVCDFIFGFLDYLTLNTWKNEKSLIHLTQYYHLKDIDYKKENIFNTDWYWQRAWSVTIEILLGIFVNLKYNINFTSNIYDKYYLVLDICKINNVPEFIKKFDKWYKINIKTGITTFCVNENVINILKDNVDLHKYINVTTNIPNNLTEIKLKINEKILCEDSLEFHKGNYKIESFNN